MTTHFVLHVLCALSVGSLAVAQDPLEEPIAAYQAADGPDDRIRALEQIAALEPPADALTRALALGLADPSGKVRAAAVRLVAAAPDRELALDALLGACEDLEKWVARAKKAAPKPEERPSKPFDPGARLSPEELARIVADAGAALEKVKESLRLLEDGIATLTPLCDALIGVRDDRAVEGLAALLPVAGPGAEGIRIADALLELGTRRALTAVCAHLRIYENRLDDLEKRERIARRAKALPAPDSWRGTADEWKARDTARREAAVRNARAAVTALESNADECAARIRAFAAARGLSGAPTNARASSWRSWSERVQDGLPESVRDRADRR